MSRIAWMTAAWLLVQPLPPPFPRDGATRVFENDLVVIWDVSWERGAITPLHEHRYTAVSVTVQPGQVRSHMPDGTTRVGGDETIGNVQYGGKGLVHREEGVSETPRRVFLMELKSRPLATTAREDGASPAFPREGAELVLSNDDITVWDYTYDPDREVPLHVHDKDEVVVELAAGRVRSISAPGSGETVAFEGGRARFVPRGTKHREEPIEGSPRVVVIQLEP